ncbi:MAG: LacI family transcriptional regulator [Prevotella sp.]|nr:LacI family transcriptional regulator [Bacteroides sp.]MCM1366057.1 LacI family transcriptional regulator [Prevotella sp.]MCM1436873.1 LacI family transcriptional regulator [Prevotella sp.]
MRRITIKDLAKDLSLSLSTVSRGLAGDKSISESTRNRISEAATRLGYRRNLHAAHLRSGRSGLIGVIVNELNSTAAANLIVGIHDALDNSNTNIIIASSDNDPARELSNLHMFANSMVDGLIVLLCDNSTNLPDFQKVISDGLPTVFCDYETDRNDSAATVTSNHHTKAFFLTEHLVKSGHRRIVHITANSILPKYPIILDAYRQALEKYDIPYDNNLVIKADINFEGGKKAVDSLLDRNIQFDAIFASHDSIAIGAMSRLREHGINIPERVAMAGYSGSDFAMVTYPPLTTVEMPFKEMGKEAAGMLLNIFENPCEKPSQVIVNGNLLIRESSLAMYTA